MKQEYTINAHPKSAFQLYVSKTKQEIKSELSKLVSSLSNCKLHPQIEYALLSEGKRLRPLLIILSAESVGGDRGKVMPLALAFELMHTATLVHDDIIDQDEIRRGKPALHMNWSINDAILTGDALIALSIDLASAYGERILRTVAQSALELCDGEKMDITFSLETATEESYFKRITEKSASLFRASTYCGALAGDGTPSEVQALSAYGENFGIAYQLRDDILDFTQKGKLIPKDLKRGIVTLPLIRAYVSSSPQQRNQLERQIQTVMNGDLNGAVTSGLLQTISQTGSLEYVETKIDEHLRHAVDSVSSLRDSECKAYLVEMASALKIMSQPSLRW